MKRLFRATLVVMIMGRRLTQVPAISLCAPLPGPTVTNSSFFAPLAEVPPPKAIPQVVEDNLVPVLVQYRTQKLPGFRAEPVDGAFDGVV